MILIGFMGSGKTTVLNKLSKSGYITVDLDRYIIDKENIAISEIFNRFGEDHFRTLERHALDDVLDNYEVIATGGGIVSTKEGRESLKNARHPIIFLDAPFEELYDRIKDDEMRPLTRLHKEELKSLYDLRLPFYKELSELTIDATLDIDTIIEIIIEWIEIDKIK